MRYDQTTKSHSLSSEISNESKPRISASHRLGDGVLSFKADLKQVKSSFRS
jgi:hypothetical protein